MRVPLQQSVNQRKFKMCLIAYVKPGSKIPEDYFRCAAHDNDDGIGIMWADGVEKFLGSKMVKRAWRLTRKLHDAGHEFAIHFRYATHGRVALVNTHPFRTPDGNAWVMHNGILSEYTPKDAGGDVSDTRNLVAIMKGVDVAGDPKYWVDMENHIGWGNKLCVMSRDGEFRIVNADAGDWIDGVWYSQTYSLPNQQRANAWADYYDRKYGSAGWSQGSSVSGIRSPYNGDYYSKDDLMDEAQANLAACRIAAKADGTQATALIPYATRAALAAHSRRDARYSAEGYALGSGTHSLPADAYRQDAEALDAELDRHFAKMDDGDVVEEEPTDICPSCETLHNNGPQCRTCGHYDESAGLIPMGMS
jgi:hypothetical protein